MRKTRKADSIGPVARKRIEAMLRSITPRRERIAKCMAFCLEHASAADAVSFFSSSTASCSRFIESGFDIKLTSCLFSYFCHIQIERSPNYSVAQSSSLRLQFLASWLDFTSSLMSCTIQPLQFQMPGSIDHRLKVD